MGRKVIKEMQVTFNGMRTITIPQPTEIKVKFRGGRKFNFKLKIEEPRLRNLVAMMGFGKKNRRKR